MHGFTHSEFMSGLKSFTLLTSGISQFRSVNNTQYSVLPFYKSHSQRQLFKDSILEFQQNIQNVQRFAQEITFNARVWSHIRLFRFQRDSYLDVLK